MYKLHGLRYCKLYQVWLAMKGRCYNKRNPAYKNYGGRGIAVCGEWLDDFKAFYTWCHKNGYSSGLEIDRVDNDGNYEPSNCRIVINLINQRNKSNVKLNMQVAEEIRFLRKSGFGLVHLAELYEVSMANISDVATNKIWKNEN